MKRTPRGIWVCNVACEAKPFILDTENLKSIVTFTTGLSYDIEQVHLNMYLLHRQQWDDSIDLHEVFWDLLMKIASWVYYHHYLYYCFWKQNVVITYMYQPWYI